MAVWVEALSCASESPTSSFHRACNMFVPCKICSKMHAQVPDMRLNSIATEEPRWYRDTCHRSTLLLKYCSTLKYCQCHLAYIMVAIGFHFTVWTQCNRRRIVVDVWFYVTAEIIGKKKTRNRRGHQNRHPRHRYRLTPIHNSEWSLPVIQKVSQWNGQVIRKDQGSQFMTTKTCRTVSKHVFVMSKKERYPSVQL